MKDSPSHAGRAKHVLTHVLLSYAVRLARGCTGNGMESAQRSFQGKPGKFQVRPVTGCPGSGIGWPVKRKLGSRGLSGREERALSAY